MLYIISIFTIYVVFILIRFRNIESISKSAYLLKGYGFIFNLWLFCVSVLLIWYYLEHTLVVIVGGGLLYIAMIPNYNWYSVSKAHCVGSTISILSGIAWMLVNGLYYYTLTYLVIITLLYWYSKRPLLWILIISFYTLMFALYTFSL